MCVCVCVCVCTRGRARARVYVRLFVVHIIIYVNCFGRTVLYVCIEYRISVNICHVSAQGVDERKIQVNFSSSSS